MHIARLLFGIIFAIVTTNIHAAEYKILLPFPPGNLADVVLRSMQASIERNTQDRLVIISMPGAETVVAANHFVTNKNIDMIWGSASQMVWNPLLKDTVKYNTQDFRNLVLVGTTTALWVTRPDTQIRAPKDLSQKLPDFVGGFATAYNLNLESVVRKFNKKSSIVPFKGTNDVIMSLLGGQLDLALVTPSGALMQYVKEGKLHIVGNTGSADIVIEDVVIPSIPQKLKVSGFNGISMVLTHADLDEHRVNRLKTLLWNALQDPAVKKTINNFYLQPDASDNQIWINNYIQREQNIAKEFLTKPVSIFK
jgi:tripartite-type tricarboxylate transporter receptor subunit TctC